MADNQFKMIKTTYYALQGEDKVFSHSHTNEWKLTDVLCPCCGDTRVWCDSGPMDYYDGPKHMCVHCGSWFFYKGYAPINEDPYDVNYQTLLQLRKNDG